VVTDLLSRMRTFLGNYVDSILETWFTMTMTTTRTAKTQTATTEQTFFGHTDRCFSKGCTAKGGCQAIKRAR